MKFTEEKVKEIVREARQAGQIASMKKMWELCRTYNKEPTTPEGYATMLGWCGGGWVKINTRQSFYRVAKKVAEDNNLRFSCGKDYPKGGSISIYDVTNRQEQDIRMAGVYAIAEVLKAHGVEVTGIHSYID